MIGNTSGPELKEKKLETKIFEKAGEALQDFIPIKRIHQHLCGIHYYAHDNKRFIEAHQYCSRINEDMYQCIIYDSSLPDAKIIGIEYIISKNIFDALNPEEKKYWHSHSYEVKSGTLYMPFKKSVPKMVSDKAEHKEMSRLINTYGKCWYFWQLDRGDQIPLGEPQLMMALTHDGQLSDECLRKIEAKHRINFQEKKDARADIAYSDPDPIANAYSF